MVERQLKGPPFSLKGLSQCFKICSRQVNEIWCYIGSFSSPLLLTEMMNADTIGTLYYDLASDLNSCFKLYFRNQFKA